MFLTKLSSVSGSHRHTHSGQSVSRYRLRSFVSLLQIRFGELRLGCVLSIIVCVGQSNFGLFHFHTEIGVLLEQLWRKCVLQSNFMRPASSVRHIIIL